MGGMDWLVRRPVAVISGAFVVGALAEAVAGEGKGIALFAALFSAAFGLAALLTPQRLPFLALASFLLGFSATRWRLPPLPPPLEAPFEGTVASTPLPMRYGYRLLLRLENSANFTSHGSQLVQLAVSADDPPPWRIGDRVKVHRFWGRPTEQRRHRFQHILWTGRTEATALEAKGTTNALPLPRLRERWRQLVFERWSQSLPERERTATLVALASIVFGMRTAAISEADERAFARSGLAHLFVPSGSQVTLLMGLAFLAYRSLGISPFPLLLLLLGFYLPITRGEPSIYRAVLMGLYAFTGWRWWRDVDWMTALWLSSAILVAVEPAMFHDVGFQLSYAATFGLFYASPLLRRWLFWLPDWMRFPVAATLSAQLFLTPVLVHYFGRVSLIAPFANLCAIFVASVALAAGFLSALLSLLSPLVAMPLSVIAGECAKLTVRMAHWFAAPSWASVLVPSISGWQMLLALLLLTALVAWVKNGSVPDESDGSP